MVAPNSGLFVPTMLDVYDTTQLAIDLDLETHKSALFLDALTGADYTADTAYGVAPYNANEVANGSGYTTGGALLVGTTWLHTSGGVTVWDATDTSWTTATFTARFLQHYADALAGNNAIIGQNFGANITATAGTFLVQYAAGGLWSVDWVP